MLYFVATPIGNLKDISYRAIEVLNSVDIIACEDTRNSLKLLNHYNINKQLIAYHKFNEENSSNGIIEMLKEGKNIAVISDSGMPLISDPGQTLVEKLVKQNLEYTIVPGASASLSALILSGLDSSRFSFVGFLPEKNKERQELISNIRLLKNTLIFYISPHSLFNDIDYLYNELGGRKACLVNEITKLYEKTIHFNLGDDLEIEPKGEYVLVVEGCNEKNLELNNLTVKEHIEFYINLGDSEKEAIKKVAKDRKVNKNDIYQQHISTKRGN